MSKSAKIVRYGGIETRTNGDLKSEPIDIDWWDDDNAPESGSDVAPAQKFVYHPTLADWGAIGKNAVFSLWHNPVILAVTSFAIGCLVGLILGYGAKP